MFQLLRICLMDWVLFCLTQSSNRELAYFGCLRATENKGDSSVVCCSNRDPAALPIDTRGSRRL